MGCVVYLLIQPASIDEIIDIWNYNKFNNLVESIENRNFIVWFAEAGSELFIVQW